MTLVLARVQFSTVDAFPVEAYNFVEPNTSAPAPVTMPYCPRKFADTRSGSRRSLVGPYLGHKGEAAEETVRKAKLEALFLTTNSPARSGVSFHALAGDCSVAYCETLWSASPARA